MKRYEIDLGQRENYVIEAGTGTAAATKAVKRHHPRELPVLIRFRGIFPLEPWQYWDSRVPVKRAGFSLA